MMRRAFSLLLMIAAVAPYARAQKVTPGAGKCALDVKFERINSIQLPSGNRNSYLGGNIVATCASQRMVLKSDSLEQYGDEGRFFFVGHVDYKEPRVKLKSDFLTYFQREDRLLAYLNVDAVLPNGSTLKGSSLEYFKPIPKVRPRQQGIAVGRPTLTIIDKDAQGKPQPPVKVTGNTIWLDGDSVVASAGEVVVVRPELTATGDSLYLDGGSGLLRMMRKPKISGTKGRPFTLVGETIDLLSRKKKLERVLAKQSSEATSDDLTLKSDTIDLRVTGDLLQRAIVWGKSRARASSPSQTIIADSIDVLLPGQRVREMHALRTASAEGTPDTTKFLTREKDRLTGDTIVAYFDSIPASDTVTKARIRELVAIWKATSYQHLAPQDTSSRLPAINYVCGQRITVTFDSAKVRRVKVLASDPPCGGIYVEPDTSRAPQANGRPGGSPPRPTAPTRAPVPSPVSPIPSPAVPAKPE